MDSSCTLFPFLSFILCINTPSISRGLKSPTRLTVMAVFAECLPIFLVPEQILVASVGDDVIHYRRRGESAFLPALNAQRMSAQVFKPRFTPLPIIATVGSTAAQPICAPTHVLFAIYLALFAELHTSGEAAGPSRFHRHTSHLDSISIRSMLGH